MTTPPARRVGLSIRNSPRQQLLKTVNFKTGTAAAATTAAATTTTTTTEKPTTTAKAKTTTATAKPTAAAQKSDPKPRGGRSQQLKIPEPIPEDIFAPPLASSDVEDDDDGDGDGKTVGKEEAGLEPNEQVRVYPDSSDEEAPPRGAISATKFTSSSQKGGRQSLRTKIASQLAGEPDEVEPGTKKRKRLFGTSKENGSPKKNASHLTNSQGFVKKQKVKASYGGRRSINSQESRKPKVSEEPSLPKLRVPISEEPTLPILRPPEFSAIKSIRKSSQFIIPDSDDFSSPIKRRQPRQRLLHVHYGNNSDTDEDNNNEGSSGDKNGDNQGDSNGENHGDNNSNAAALDQPKSPTEDIKLGKNKPKGKRRQNPLARLAKKNQNPAKSPSPPPARFIMPALLSEFKIRSRLSGGGDNNDMDNGDLSDAGSSSSDLSSLGDIFPDKEAPKDGQALCPWCGASVDRQQLKEFSEGRQRLSVKMQTKFCESHRKTSAQETYQLKSYPKVQWDSLTERFESHRARLLGIINDEEESHYRTALADKISLGKGRSMNKEENLNPGYYGPRGFNMMCDYLVAEFSDLLKKKAIHDKVIAGRGPPAFIQSVLVPELGVQLIMEDMHVSPQEARGILEESKALGELVHGEI
ncbi:RTC4-like domain-containing protein [Trichoderma sp. SZMC 28014]